MTGKEENEQWHIISFLKKDIVTYILLIVSVPPQKISIIDEKGEEVSSRTSPYEEGGDMKLTCIVTGGK